MINAQLFSNDGSPDVMVMFKGHQISRARNSYSDSDVSANGLLVYKLHAGDTVEVHCEGQGFEIYGSQWIAHSYFQITLLYAE